VGRGSVTVRGFSWLISPGTYALNGGERRMLPAEPFTFQLAAEKQDE
jgi:hypothetical protein